MKAKGPDGSHYRCELRAVAIEILAIGASGWTMSIVGLNGRLI